MDGAFVAILSNRFSGDRANDAFEEFLFRLVPHRFELSNPSAKGSHPVGPTLHLGEIIKPLEWKGISCF